MRLTGVDSSFPNPATPRRRCRHKSLTDWSKPFDGCCQNCLSWTDTSVALLHGETERPSILLVELRANAIYSWVFAKRSQFFAIFPIACESQVGNCQSIEKNLRVFRSSIVIAAAAAILLTPACRPSL